MCMGAELTVVHVFDPGRGVPGGRVKEKEMEREEQAKREGMLVLDSINPGKMPCTVIHS